jgi:hypothetical protein
VPVDDLELVVSAVGRPCVLGQRLTTSPLRGVEMVIAT